MHSMNTTVATLDIVRHPVFYLEQNLLKTKFCLNLQVAPVHLSRYLQDPSDQSPSETRDRIQYPKICVSNMTGQWIKSRMVTVIRR
jgi:hypothetical protein